MSFAGALSRSAFAAWLATSTLGCSQNAEPENTTIISSDPNPQGVRTERDRAIERGIEWLIAQQHDDGSWRSTTYGQMRGGVGNTALIVYALAQLPRSKHAGAHTAAERGVSILLTNLAIEGFVRGDDGSSDYPTYGTALLLAALPKLSVEVPPEKLAQMQAYIRSVQQSARQGLEPDDPTLGGWNQTGGVEAELKNWDRSSISATRVALEALAAGDKLDADARRAALKYLSRCRNWSASGSGDGGFFFTPDLTDPRNKAGVTSPTSPRSYGSATVDGLLALVLCGEPESSPRRKAAVAWLDERFNADAVPGFTDPNPNDNIATGLYYYYVAGLANALGRVPELDSAARRTALTAALIHRQQPDGSWRNPSPIMYEDDPLIATALAVAALGALEETNE